MSTAMADVLPYVLMILWAIIVFLRIHLLERATTEAEARSGQSQDFRSELKKKIKENGRFQKAVAALKMAVATLKERGAGQNETVAALKKTVAALKKTVAGLKKTVAGLKKTVAGLKKTVAALNDQLKVRDEQIAHLLKVEQDLRAKQLQPVGEDQTGVSAIHASEGEPPRHQSGTDRKETEISSSESKATTSEMLVNARTNVNISEPDKKLVDKVLKDNSVEPFSRKNLLVSSGIPAIGTAVPSQRGLILRQINSDYKDRLSVIEKAINPKLPNGISGAYSALVRVVMVSKLEKPQLSDLVNGGWLQKHHIPNSQKQFCKDNLRSAEEADKWLEILEKAAIEGKGNLGLQYFRYLKKIAELNHEVHLKVDLEEVIKDGYAWDGEDLRELLEFLRRTCSLQ